MHIHLSGYALSCSFLPNIAYKKYMSRPYFFPSFFPFVPFILFSAAAESPRNRVFCEIVSRKWETGSPRWRWWRKGERGKRGRGRKGRSGSNSDERCDADDRQIEATFATSTCYHGESCWKRAPRHAAGSFPSDERYHVIFYPQIPPYPRVVSSFGTFPLYEVMIPRAAASTHTKLCLERLFPRVCFSFILTFFISFDLFFIAYIYIYIRLSRTSRQRSHEDCESKRGVKSPLRRF